MTAELIISIISLIASSIIGILQINSSKNQKLKNKQLQIRIEKLEISKTIQSGIIGNSNKGNISKNTL